MCIRDRYIGMRYIQQEFKDRYKAHYIITDRLMVRFLVKLIHGFSKRGVIQKTFSNEKDAILEIEKDMKEW